MNVKNTQYIPENSMPTQNYSSDTSSNMFYLLHYNPLQVLVHSIRIQGDNLRESSLNDELSHWTTFMESIFAIRNAECIDINQALKYKSELRQS